MEMYPYHPHSYWALIIAYPMKKWHQSSADGVTCPITHVYLYGVQKHQVDFLLTGLMIDIKSYQFQMNDGFDMQF